MATNRYENKVCPHFLVLEERDDLKSDTATFEERYTMVTNWVGTGLKLKWSPSPKNKEETNSRNCLILLLPISSRQLIN